MVQVPGTADRLPRSGDYSGDYKWLKRVLTTGRLQHVTFFGDLRASCDEAVKGNQPAQWHIDSVLWQPEVQRRLQVSLG